MRTIEEILAISVERKGSEEAVFDGFCPSRSTQDIASITDDRWLAEMTRAIFQAGFNWKVVDRMWPGFETAFDGFAINCNAMMNEERMDELCNDASIVRYPQKIQSVQKNAVYIQTRAARHDGFGAFIARWPVEDFSGLLEELKKNANRLGGTTGQYFLRAIGVDGYILSRDVVARLISEGVIDKPPTSKVAMKKVQDAMNEWTAQSGHSLKQISRILATSCG